MIVSFCEGFYQDDATIHDDCQFYEGLAWNTQLISPRQRLNLSRYLQETAWRAVFNKFFQNCDLFQSINIYQKLPSSFGRIWGKNVSKSTQIFLSYTVRYTNIEVTE